ncbi:MAG: LLM class flavin-dependent oxidoreductase, partial [Candidatus Brockarchaeota archaeon]|nr:LLM class flavin-dependent oxidoreductase [Candidatus Brockarchaeota archaeon]
TAPELFKEDLEGIRGRAEKAGRRAGDIRNGLLIYTLAGKDRAAVEKLFEPLAIPTMLWVNCRSLRRLGYPVPRSPAGAPREALKKMAAYGAHQDVAQSLGAFIDAGVEHFVLGVLPPERTEEQLQVFADEVLPLL